MEVVANDISKAAIASIKENVKANGVEEFVSINEDDARYELYFF